MNYIIKKREATNPKSQRAEPVYELFVPETVSDIEGNDVTIPKSVGIYSRSLLENQIAELQEKLKSLPAEEELPQ